MEFYQFIARPRCFITTELPYKLEYKMTPYFSNEKTPFFLQNKYVI
jgi:hypothetical protein